MSSRVRYSIHYFQQVHTSITFNLHPTRILGDVLNTQIHFIIIFFVLAFGAPNTKSCYKWHKKNHRSALQRKLATLSEILRPRSLWKKKKKLWKCVLASKVFIDEENESFIMNHPIFSIWKCYSILILYDDFFCCFCFICWNSMV